MVGTAGRFVLTILSALTIVRLETMGHILPANKHLVAFQSYFHKLFASYTAAGLGMHMLGKRLRDSGANAEGNLLIGNGVPGTGGPVHAVVPNSLILSGGADCLDALAKGVLCMTYAHWESYVRSALARDADVKVDSVRCDLMGDLRRIRHCVLHENSRITNRTRHMQVLDWHLSEGEHLIVSDKELEDFARQIYGIAVRVG
jgi:hypothetical protein